MRLVGVMCETDQKLKTFPLHEIWRRIFPQIQYILKVYFWRERLLSEEWILNKWAEEMSTVQLHVYYIRNTRQKKRPSISFLC